MKKAFLLIAVAMMSMGRMSAEVPTSSPSADPSGPKYAGIFYFVWLGQHGEQQDGIYDISKLLKTDPEGLFQYEGSASSPSGKYHFWGEPLYGYYNSCDPWVMSRHIELFLAAGLDYLMLDTTNAYVYPGPVTTLLNVLKSYAAQGFDVPKVAFYTNTQAGKSVRMIYDNFFQTDEWDGLFFSPKGKPLVVSVTKNNKGSSDQPLGDLVDDEMMEFFDVRESQWPNRPLVEDTYPWMSWDNPQKIHNGVISVSVAQHSVEKVCFSDTLNCRGRGWDSATGKNIHSDMRTGRNFSNQWKTVFDNIDKVDNVFVTGWNEWVALKLHDGKRNTVFVDLYNEEFSRDCEMMKGGYGDNFYLLLRDNIQRYKGGCGTLLPENNVYRDVQGDAMARNFKNFCGSFDYVDNSARNDITTVKVTNDASEIRFTVTTAEPVTGYEQGDLGWMNILIKTDDSPAKAFEYDYVINRYPTVNGSTTVERISANGKKVCGKAAYSVKGNVLEVRVPVEALGLDPASVHFEFKVSDNVTHPDDIMDYYISGDSAPIGRLSYKY